MMPKMEFSIRTDQPIVDSFSCKLFFRRLYLSLEMRYFISFALKIVHLRSKYVRFGSYLRPTDVMYEVLTPGIRRKYPERAKIAENFVDYARITMSEPTDLILGPI